MQQLYMVAVIARGNDPNESLEWCLSSRTLLFASESLGVDVCKSEGRCAGSYSLALRCFRGPVATLDEAWDRDSRSELTDGIDLAGFVMY